MSPLKKQQERDRFIKKATKNSFFKALKQRFIAAVQPIGQQLLMMALDVYSNQEMTEAERIKAAEKMGSIGNQLIELPFKMLKGGMDEKNVKTGFSEFFKILRDVQEFFEENPKLAGNVGQKLERAMQPLQNFIDKATSIVEQSPMPDELKKGVIERLGQVKTRADQVTKSLHPELLTHVSKIAAEVINPEGDITNMVQPAIQIAKMAMETPLLTDLRKQFLSAVFPIGGTILNVALDLHNANLLNDKQRSELTDIGRDIMRIPYQLLSGKTDFNGAVTKLEESLKSLGSFFLSNPEIAVKAGATISSSLVPMNGFLQTTLNTTGVPSLLMKGFKFLAENIDTVKNVVEMSKKVPGKEP